MDRVRIRRAEVVDLDTLLVLFGQLAGASTAAAPTDRAASLPVLIQILADPARYLAVAVSGLDVVGSADLTVIPNLTHGAKPFAVVENVIVDEAARRTGAGTALLRHLIGVARQAGCYKLQLHSGKQRAEAHAFYRRLGLEPVAEGFKIYL